MAGWAVYDRLGFIFALYLLVHRFDRFGDQFTLGCLLMTSLHKKVLIKVVKVFTFCYNDGSFFH